MSARGQKFTVVWREVIYYSDFLDSFATDPQTGALATATNVDSIEQSIRNLVETDPGERVGRNAVGGKVRATLFSLATPADMDLLQTTIQDVIKAYEPRALNPTAVVDASTVTDNAVTVTLTYTPVNLPQLRTLVLVLQRVR